MTETLCPITDLDEHRATRVSKQLLRRRRKHNPTSITSHHNNQAQGGQRTVVRQDCGCLATELLTKGWFKRHTSKARATWTYPEQRQSNFSTRPLSLVPVSDSALDCPNFLLSYSELQSVHLEPTTSTSSLLVVVGDHV